MADDNFNVNELNVLLAEYKARRDEIMLLAQRYGNFMTSVVALISSIIVIVRLVAGDASILSKLVTGSSAAWLPSLLIIAAPMLIFYLIASAMDSVHILQLNGLRCGEIENAINKMIGKKLLIWEVSITPELLWERSFKSSFFWVQPNVLQAVFLAGLMAISAFMLNYLACIFMKNYFVAYTIFIWSGLVFLIAQWYLLVTHTRIGMAARIKEISTYYTSGP